MVEANPCPPNCFVTFCCDETEPSDWVNVVDDSSRKESPAFGGGRKWEGCVGIAVRL